MIFKPDFNNMLKVLRREPTEKPVLYEFYIDWGPIRQVLKDRMEDPDNPPFGWVKNCVNAYVELGYDTFTMGVPGFAFNMDHGKKTETISQNEGGVIFDDESFAKFPWPDPDTMGVKTVDSVAAFLDIVQSHCPAGMKMMLGCGGIMEALVNLAGFDNLCLMIFENPGLVEKMAREVGTRTNRMFEICMGHPVVGAGVISDDWGFKSSTMLSPEVLRKYIFPWHKKCARTIHDAGKPAVLHACGQVAEVMEDVIEDIGYDAKHSFEDVILPVEEAYEKWGRRIAILGGFDVQFMTQASPAEVYQRAKAILRQTRQRGGYALGTGNSVTNYTSMDNYYAMLKAAREGYE